MSNSTKNKLSSLSSSSSWCLTLLILGMMMCCELVVETRAWILPPKLPQRQQTTTSTTTATTTTSLWAKGLNRARNKQGDLKRKLELAKQQNKGKDDSDSESSDTTATKTTSSAASSNKNILTDKEIQERIDRRRFDELLRRESSLRTSEFTSEGYLSKEQEEEEIDAALAGVDRLYEGNVAPTDCFEELVSIQSSYQTSYKNSNENENAIGPEGKERLVPWLRKHKSNSKSKENKDYLVVLCDPRPKSVELRQTLANLRVDLPLEIFNNHFMVINADSPSENRRWLKKSKLLLGQQDEDEEEGIGLGKSTKKAVSDILYSDEKMQWMRAYTALGEQRWGMTVFVLSDGEVSRLARDVDLYSTSKTIRNAVASLLAENK